MSYQAVETPPLGTKIVYSYDAVGAVVYAAVGAVVYAAVGAVEEA